MAVAFQSIATTAYNADASLVITKPSGLAVGDLMLAVVQGENNAGTGQPSGFTLLKDLQNTGAAGRMWVSWKIATSGDVAATDFTFTKTASVNLGGGILRIDGTHSTNPVERFGFANASATSTPTFASTVTPDKANSLILFCLSTVDDTQNTSSGYAIVTSDPTWTERMDMFSANIGASGYMQVAVATATRPEVTATGDASCTMSASTNQLGNVMVVVRPQVIITASETSTTTDTLNKKPNKVILETTTTTDSLTTSKEKDWDNQAKNTNDWTNQTKH